MYLKAISWIKKAMDVIARYLLLVSFSIIFVVGLLVKAMYRFDDSPYFELITGYDFFCTILVILIFSFIYVKREWIQKNLNYKICFILFAAAAGFFIWQVPLTPFSDMGAIYKGALNFARFDWEAMLNDSYWEMFPGNLRLAVFWGILVVLLPKGLATFKVVNATMIYIIILLTRLLAKEYGVKYYNVVYLLLLTFSPLFLYINCIYFDIPLIVFCLLGLYIYKKKNNIILAFVFIGLACFLRKSGTVFMVAMIIGYLFENKTMWKEKTWKKKLGVLVVASVLCLGINKMCTVAVSEAFIGDKYQPLSSWNFYYIGLNEEEFGFQNNDFSYERSAQDVINRITEYGPGRLSKILVKKTFWLWSQGTYQAQRYAFGIDVENALDKFEYETFFTRYLLRDCQNLRMLINAFMRAQYYILFGLMILTIYDKQKTDKYRVFYYIFTATFLVMLVYELKSRYILQLLPLMVIMAGDRIENRFELVEKCVELRLRGLHEKQ